MTLQAITYNPFAFHFHQNIHGDNLHEAVSSGDVNSVLHFLDQNMDVNAYDSDGKTALHIAAEKGFAACVQLLIYRGASLESPDQKFQATPLHFAASNNCVHVIKQLISLGANLNMQDQDGCTPLHWATYWNAYEAVIILINMKADCCIKTYDGADALVLASIANHVRMITLLCKIGLSEDYVKKYINMKVFSSFCGLAGEACLSGSKVINIEGGSPNVALSQLTDSFELFIKKEPLPHWLSSNACQQLLDTLKISIQALHHAPDQILHKIHTLPALLVLGGWSRHSVNLLFYHSYLLICNKGEGHNTCPIMVYKIDKKKLTRDVIEKIQWAKLYYNEPKGTAFIYDELPQLLQATDKDALQSYFSNLSMQWQQIGNCTTASVKTVIRAFLMLSAYDAKLSQKEAERLVYAFYKKWTEFARIYFFEKYVLDYVEDGCLTQDIDLSLVSRFISKWHRKGKHTPIYQKKMNELCQRFNLKETALCMIKC